MRSSSVPDNPGPPLAHRLAGAGMRVAIVERYRFGGTCVNTGCTPTKTLVASAYVAHVARRAGEYGVKIDGLISVDMKKVKEGKHYVLGFSTRGVERGLRSDGLATKHSPRRASSSMWAAAPPCPTSRG
jgi:pyruvate/2-oxoglutarate dehydrogenase complex dihydrolipoamide dehydrogenase (E3) component